MKPKVVTYHILFLRVRSEYTFQLPVSEVAEYQPYPKLKKMINNPYMVSSEKKGPYYKQSLR